MCKINQTNKMFAFWKEFFNGVDESKGDKSNTGIIMTFIKFSELIFLNFIGSFLFHARKSIVCKSEFIKM